MKKLFSLFITFVLCSFSVSAVEVVVNWQEPKSFTDIKAANEHPKRFRNQVINQLTKHWQSHAEQLPEGTKLVITMTNLNLAGEVRYNFSMHRDIRIVSQNYWPMMSFEYKLVNGDQVILEGSEKLKDMSFMHRGSTLRAKRISHYYEKRIISDWFVEQLQVMLARYQRQQTAVMV